jgi:hypothetical protein
MGHVEWLRKGPVSRRALTAAAAGAGALALAAVLPAAGAPRQAWPKAWAEQLLRKSYDAVTVICLPLGPAIRQQGENAFREFVCSLATVDGTRYTIRLQPRTHTTWKTISLKRDRVPPSPGGKPPKTHPAHGSG